MIQYLHHLDLCCAVVELFVARDLGHVLKIIIELGDPDKETH